MKNNNNSSEMTRRKFIKTSLIGCAAAGSGIIGFPSIVYAKTELKVGYIPILDHITLAVSHKNDNNNYKNVNVTPRLFKSWTSVAGALKAKQIDAAYLLSNYAMDLFNNNLPIKSILVGHRNGSGITVGNNSKIESPQDLKGKKIAIPAMVSTHTALLDKYLSNVGLSLKDVETMVVPPPRMIQAMKHGVIDAFIVAEPFCAKAESTNVGRIMVFSKEILAKHICCVVVARKDVLKNNPEGIREWVRSLKKSGKFIEEDKANNGGQKVAQIVAGYTPHKPKDILNAMQNPHDRILYEDLHPRISDYQSIINISKRAGILGDVNLNEFIDSSFSNESS